MSMLNIIFEVLCVHNGICWSHKVWSGHPCGHRSALLNWPLLLLLSLISFFLQCVCVCARACIVCVYVHALYVYVHNVSCKSLPCCVCSYCLRTENWEEWISMLPKHHCESLWKCASHLWYTQFICPPPPPPKPQPPPPPPTHTNRCTSTMRWGMQNSNNYIEYVFHDSVYISLHFWGCDLGGFDLPCICLQARWGDSYHTQFRSVMPGPMLYMCHQPSAVNAFCLSSHPYRHRHCTAEFAGTLMQPKSGSTGSSPHPQNVVSSTSTRQLTKVLTCE